MTASLIRRGVPSGRVGGTVPRTCPCGPNLPGRSRRMSVSATAQGLSLGPVRNGQGSRGHQRSLVDELDQAAQHVRVGVGDDTVAEVEDVARAAAGASEHVLGARRYALPGA